MMEEVNFNILKWKITVGTMGLGPTTPVNRSQPTEDHRMMAQSTSSIVLIYKSGLILPRVGHIPPRHCLLWPVNIFKKASE